jgi:hypothetical protein
VLTATLRKGHRGLPVFFDELNDALEAHDAEEYGRIAGAGRCSPVTMIRRKRYPANKCIL